MAEHNKTNRSSIAFRRRSIEEADSLFARAKAVAARADVESAGAFLWSEAGSLYERAASLFRRADLGLMAREIYAQASYCLGRAAASDDARRCDRLSRAIPPYWETDR
jgi:hypothetical protein